MGELVYVSERFLTARQQEKIYFPNGRLRPQPIQEFTDNLEAAAEVELAAERDRYELEQIAASEIVSHTCELEQV